jgi:hypothetical protein
LEALVLAASLLLRRTIIVVVGVLDLLNLGLLSSGVSSGIHILASNCANRCASTDGGWVLWPSSPSDDPRFHLSNCTSVTSGSGWGIRGHFASPVEESVMHMFFSCPFAQIYWASLGLLPPQTDDPFVVITIYRAQLHCPFALEILITIC